MTHNPNLAFMVPIGEEAHLLPYTTYKFKMWQALHCCWDDLITRHNDPEKALHLAPEQLYDAILRRAHANDMKDHWKTQIQ